MGLLMKSAREEHVSELDIIINIANFGATFALEAYRNPMGTAREIELGIMSESDESDDYKDNSRWFEKWARDHPLLDDDDEEDGDHDGND
jgi:hypothetical protein